MIERIIEFAKEKMEGSHTFDHVLRVVRFCEIIGQNENARMDILIPAAYLHDIARPLEEKNGSIDHAKAGSQMAFEFLKSIEYPCAAEISYAISVHRFSKGLIPETLEAKILQDADRLDAIGAMGIYRTIAYSALNGRNVEETIAHFENKILNLKDLMHTNTAKKMAEKRHQIVFEFVRALKEDLTQIGRQI
ncbi:HD domain-containing protein [Athalassotoga saccharophila]|uniref:HD domain-containing protein n=1 Tax=Athalassotoga saccharophila TaxID=1441386 RepID=UPI00137B174A|nr:HD domain-containing protein [Athalassotoga saccharophila]BBJ27674.1 metal-dependent phosphohydrolase [Athalassotoga saccharophila]